MRPTVTVWVLHLNRPETFVCGPYPTEAAAVRARLPAWKKLTNL